MHACVVAANSLEDVLGLNGGERLGVAAHLEGVDVGVDDRRFQVGQVFKDSHLEHQCIPVPGGHELFGP